MPINVSHVCAWCWALPAPASAAGADFTCPLDIYQLLPAINITAALPCAEGTCEVSGGCRGVDLPCSTRQRRLGDM